MTDDTRAPLFPLIGFNIGDLASKVTLRLEYAVNHCQLTASEGETQQYVMTPSAAITIGQALIERAAQTADGSRA